MSIAIWGCGHLGESLVRGFLYAGMPAEELYVSNRRSDTRLDEMQRRYGVRVGRSVEEADAEIVLLLMRPADVEDAALSLRGRLSPQTTVVSCAAAVQLAALRQIFGEQRPLLRAMPNLNAEVGLGFTAIAAQMPGAREVAAALKLFARLGDTEVVAEQVLDKLTILSGSGPALMAAFWQYLLGASGSLGIDEAVATRALGPLFQGTPHRFMAGASPEAFIAQVATPGGVTQALLGALERGSFGHLLSEAFQTAARHGRTIAT